MMLFASLGITIAAAFLWYSLVGGPPIFSNQINIARTTNSYFAVRQFMFFAPVAFWIALCYPSYVLKISFFSLCILSLQLSYFFSTGYRTFPVGFVLISIIILFARGFITKIDIRFTIMTAVLGYAVLSFGVYRNSLTLEFTDTRTSVAQAFQAFFNRPIALQDISDVFPFYEPHTGISLYERGFGFLIPGKNLGVGAWLKEQVLNASFVGGGYNPGLLGEFYIVGGYSALFLGIFLWGAMLTYFIRMSSNRAPVISVAGAILAFFTAISISPGFATSIVTVFFYMLFLFGKSWFCFPTE